MNMLIHIVKKFYRNMPLPIQLRYFLKKIVLNIYPSLINNESKRLNTGIKQFTLPVIDNPMEFAKTLEFKIVPNPLVSIIIPTYSCTEKTLSCLLSIQQSQTQASFEIILIDDASPDNNVEILRQIKGTHLIQHETNKGFIESTLDGVLISKGKYLHFLNNDTFVLNGWLDELLATFNKFEQVGLVGSQFLYPDGYIQEAGSFIDKNCHAIHLGSKENPINPFFNYAKKVIYCSAASVLIEKNFFIELDQFNKIFSPGYWEDVDLCMRIRESGKDVWYQPASKVIHYGSASAEKNDRMRSFIPKNLISFRKLWEKKLESYDPFYKKGFESRFLYKKNILFLSNTLPKEDHSVGCVTLINLLKLSVKLGHHVTLFLLDNHYDDHYTKELQYFGIEVLHAPFIDSLESHLKLYKNRYEIIYFFGFYSAYFYIQNQFSRYLKHAKTIFHAIDLESIRLNREASIKKEPNIKKRAEYVKKIENIVINYSDLTIVHSVYEKNYLTDEGFSKPIILLPLILNVPEGHNSFEERKDFVFVGGYQHPPNVDAAHYLVETLMPFIRKLLPGVRCHLVGSNMPNSMHKLASEDVILHGFIPNLSDFLNKMRISIAPLRYGAGIKGKVGFSMMAGLPVVGTSTAFEGMQLSDGINCLISDDPEKISEKIYELYTQKEKWLMIRKNGIEIANKLWSLSVAQEQLSFIYELALGEKTIETHAILS